MTYTMGANPFTMTGKYAVQTPQPVGPPIIAPGPPVGPIGGSPFVGGDPWGNLGSPLPFDDVFTPIGDVFDDVTDFIGDVQDLLDVIGLGGGGGGDVSQFIDLDEDKKQKATIVALESQSGLKTAFINFLKTAGVISQWIHDFTNSPVPNWPTFIINLAVMWLERSRPATVATAGGAEIGRLIGPPYTDNNTLPVPGGGGVPVTPLPGIMPGFDHLAAFMQPVLQATPTMVYRAPKGYVTVTHPQTGQKAFVLKSIAKGAGLYKERKKAPISGKEWAMMQKAKRLENKLVNMTKKTCATVKVTKARCR